VPQIHQLASSVGVGVYFNTLVPIGNQVEMTTHARMLATECLAVRSDALCFWSHHAGAYISILQPTLSHLVNTPVPRYKLSPMP
jgi:hypothetical protein